MTAINSYHIDAPDLIKAAKELISAGDACDVESAPEPVKKITDIVIRFLVAAYPVIELAETGHKNNAQSISVEEQEEIAIAERNALNKLKLIEDTQAKNDAQETQGLLSRVTSALKRFITTPLFISTCRINCEFNTIAPPPEVDKIVSAYRRGNHKAAFYMIGNLKNLDEDAQASQCDRIIKAKRNGETWAEDFSQIIQKEKDIREVARLRSLPEDIKDKQIKALIQARKEGRQGARKALEEGRTVSPEALKDGGLCTRLFLKSIRNAQTYKLENKAPLAVTAPPAAAPCAAEPPSPEILAYTARRDEKLKEQFDNGIGQRPRQNRDMGTTIFRAYRNVPHISQ